MEQIKRSKTAAVIMLVMMVLLLLPGCMSSTASASGIQEEIVEFDNYSAAGLSITSYEETLRKTSKEDGTDMVKASVTAENELMEMRTDYSLLYVKYDNGWVLESIYRENVEYTAKAPADMEAVKADALEIFNSLAFACELDEVTAEEPMLISSELRNVNGDPHCVYSITCSGENEVAEVQTELMLYYTFDQYVGWIYSQESSEKYEATLNVIPKESPSESLAEQALNELAVKDYQFVCQIDGEEDTVEFTYYAVDDATYKYLTIHYNYFISCAFDAASGWYVDDVQSEVIDTDIDATGIWTYDDGTGEQSYYFEITSVDEEQVSYSTVITITDWLMVKGETTNTVSSNGETIRQNWEKTSAAEYSLETENYVFKHEFGLANSNEYFLEFRAYSGDRYEETGFYFNDCRLVKE